MFAERPRLTARGGHGVISTIQVTVRLFSQNVTGAPVVRGLCRPSIPVRSHSRSLSAQFANWHISAHSLDSSLIMHLRFFVVGVFFFFFSHQSN